MRGINAAIVGISTIYGFSFWENPPLRDRRITEFFWKIPFVRDRRALFAQPRPSWRYAPSVRCSPARGSANHRGTPRCVRCGGYREVRWLSTEVRGWFWQYRARAALLRQLSPLAAWDLAEACPPDQAGFAMGGLLARLQCRSGHPRLRRHYCPAANRANPHRDCGSAANCPDPTLTRDVSASPSVPAPR